MSTEINLSEKFALVRKGGSIGTISRITVPVFVTGGRQGEVLKTGNNKEVLQAEAKQLRKYLSSTEKSYYGLGYTVVELTPAKIKEINMLINFRK